MAFDDNIVKEAEITRRGLLNMQVCVPKEWDDEQVHTFAEKENSCGTTLGWVITKQGHELLAGADERVRCEKRPTFVHIMLHC